MSLFRFIAEHAPLFFGLFALGCVVSLAREFRPGLAAPRRRFLQALEWCLLPPGFVAIFIALQQRSVSSFALHPTATILACVGAAALATLLIAAQKRKRPAALAWLGGLLGLPTLIFALVILGMYFQSPQKFETIRTVYRELAATEGRTAPDLAFTLLANGEQRRLSDYRGRMILLNTWATWCVPCLAELPDLDRLQKKYHGTGLVVLNLSDEDPATISAHLAKHPMTTTHGRVERREVPEFYRFGGARPTSFLIGAKGEVLKTVVGARDLEYFESLVLAGR